MEVEIYKLQRADDHGGGDAERDLAWVGVHIMKLKQPNCKKRK